MQKGMRSRKRLEIAGAIVRPWSSCSFRERANDDTFAGCTEVALGGDRDSKDAGERVRACVRSLLGLGEQTDPHLLWLDMHFAYIHRDVRLTFLELQSKKLLAGYLSVSGLFFLHAPFQGLHLNDGCRQSRSSISSCDLPANSESTSTFSRFLLLQFIQSRSRILEMRIKLLVTKFSPLPMGKLGPSFGRKLHVEMRPPTFPNMTTVPRET